MKDILRTPIGGLKNGEYYKEPLKNFINNIKRIEYGSAGIETSLTNKQIDKEEKSTIELLTKGNSNNNIDKAIGLFSTETIDIFKNAVLEETNLDLFKTTEEKQEILLKYSEVIYLIMHFNKIYNGIYGSQLKILQRLNSSLRENKETIKLFYDFAKSTWPKVYESSPYDNYLEYLSSFQLILINSDNSIQITILGRDFLKYIIESGLSIEKNL